MFHNQQSRVTVEQATMSVNVAI